VSGSIDRRELRTFGLSLGAVCLIWAGILWWRGHTDAIPWLLGAAPVLALLALVAPITLWPLHKVWMPVARGIAHGLTWLLLTIAFYLVFTPYSVGLKLLGKDPLHRTLDRTGRSYWIRRSHEPFDPERLEKQY
jgi:hypothetical protein